MSNFIPGGIRARSLNLPVVVAIAGFGAAVALAAPSTAFAQGKLCPVAISVTSTETLGALQVTADYATASAIGDIVECTIAPSGLTDVDVDELADTATMGYADAAGFSGPSLFATCYFRVTNAADPDPVAGDFVLNVDDASNTDVPPDPVSPVLGVVVGACVPSGSCPFSPATGCKLPFAAGKSQLKLADNADDTKDQGQFQWKSGSATLIGELGTPLDSGDTYSWCLYDGGELVRGSDIPAAGTCGAKPCWKATGTTGFLFKGDAEGVALIKMKSGADGKAQVQVKAKSKLGNFASPALPLSTNVVSQFVIDNGVSSTCFQSTFTAPTTNTALGYGSKD